MNISLGTISGQVELGANNVIHPLVEIKQDIGAGPIIIGDLNIINETCVIHNR